MSGSKEMKAAFLYINKAKHMGIESVLLIR